jgi:uncharacterized iron-regulated membrane protein
MNTTTSKRKNKKSLLKKTIGWLHLWLGLTSGLIVFVVALTGTLFVFCDETIDFLAGEAQYVQETPKDKLSTEELLASFRKQYPKRKIFYYEAYHSPKRSFKIASGDEKLMNFTYTWLNPYTGQTLGASGAYWFFYLVAHIHSELLLHETGKTIVGFATIIFLMQLIGGLILWFPKNKSAAKQRFWFKWKPTTRWKRKNYDLHNILGFYSLVPAILITVTGLVMAFEIVGYVAQKTFGGNPNADNATKKYLPVYQPNNKTIALDSVIQRQFRKGQHMEVVRLSVLRKDSMTYYQCTAASKIGILSYVNGQRCMVDKYTGQDINFPNDIVQHKIIEDVNFDLHVGYWYGMPTKIFTFIIGLICTSLPITGFLIWWGRKKKAKER